MNMLPAALPGPTDEGIEGVTHHLFGRHTHRLDSELAPTHVKEVLQVGAQQVDDENVVETFLTEIVHLWHAS